MGVREDSTATSKGIHVRRFDLRVTTEKPGPVIQVINTDHQHIGMTLFSRLTSLSCSQLSQKNTNSKQIPQSYTSIGS